MDIGASEASHRVAVLFDEATPDPEIEDQVARLARWFSPLRLEPYLLRVDGDADRALALYEWNEQLSAALFEVVASAEVLVRNAAHARLKATTPSNALHSWLTDSSTLLPKQLAAVSEATARIGRSNKTATEDRVVAGLYLSFWAQLLGGKYEDLWRERLAGAFPHAPDRNHLAGPINRLVQIRNRIAHHETLIDQPVKSRFDDALLLAASIDPQAAEWILRRERVTALLSACPAPPPATST